MNIFICASPGSASQTLISRLEFMLGKKRLRTRTDAGIGNIQFKIKTIHMILRKMKLSFLYNDNNLFYGHFFPTKKNLKLANIFYKNNHYLVTYRNIYEQINYFYKFSEFKNRGPLSIIEDNQVNNDNIDKSDISLNIYLLMYFYKMWFSLIQKKKIVNYTLMSFNEIISRNESYDKKIKILVKGKFKESDISDNIGKSKKYEIDEEHINIVKNFVTQNKDVDFSILFNNKN